MNTTYDAMDSGAMGPGLCVPASQGDPLLAPSTEFGAEDDVVAATQLNWTNRHKPQAEVDDVLALGAQRYQPKPTDVVTWWTVVWMVLERLIALGIAVGGAAFILAWWPVFRLPAAAAGPFAVVWAAGMLWIFLRKH